MQGENIIEVTQPEDFELVYDLPDPRSYYRGLRPLQYRSPEIVAGYLRDHAETIMARRGCDRPQSAVPGRIVTDAVHHGTQRM